MNILGVLAASQSAQGNARTFQDQVVFIFKDLMISVVTVKKKYFLFFGGGGGERNKTPQNSVLR